MDLTRYLYRPGCSRRDLQSDVLEGIQSCAHDVLVSRDDRTAHAFVDATGAIPPSVFGALTSFWQRIEQPLLRANPDVKVIPFHAPDGTELGRWVRDGKTWRQEGPLSRFEQLMHKAREGCLVPIAS